MYLRISFLFVISYLNGKENWPYILPHRTEMISLSVTIVSREDSLV